MILIDGPLGTKFPSLQIETYEVVSEWCFKESEDYHSKKAN